MIDKYGWYKYDGGSWLCINNYYQYNNYGDYNYLSKGVSYVYYRYGRRAYHFGKLKHGISEFTCYNNYYWNGGLLS